MNNPQVASPARMTKQALMVLARKAWQGDEPARQTLMLHWYKLAPKAARMLAAADLSPEVLHELAIDAALDTTQKAMKGEIRTNPDAVYFQTLVGKVSNLREHRKVEQRLWERARNGDPAAVAWSSARTDDGKTTLRSRVRMALRALSPVNRQLLTLVKGERRSVADAAELLEINPRTAEDWLVQACQEFLERYGAPDEESSP